MKRLFALSFLFPALLLSAAPEVIEGPAPIPAQNRNSTRGRTDKLFVVTALYRNLPFSVNSGAMLGKLQRQYRQAGVQIFGVFGDDKATVRKFAEEHPEFDFTLCADPSFQTFVKLTGGDANAFSRATIVNEDGKTLWSGDPVDLAMMLERITKDRYSESEEARLAELNTVLQAALRSGEPGLIEQAADKVLAVRPEQISALNAKAFALENRRDYAALGAFLKKRVRRYPAMPEAWYMLIDLACRVPQLANELPEAVRGFFRQFPGDAEGKIAVVWNLLNNAPQQSMPLILASEGLADLAGREAAVPAAARSRYLAARALYSCRIGDFEAAIRDSEEAIAAAGSEGEKAYLKTFLEYYRTARTLGAKTAFPKK